MPMRVFAEKQRGNPVRKTKAVYLIIAEGNNKTETLYFSHFQEQGKDYYLRFVKAGSGTDADTLYRRLVKKWNEEGLSDKDGDKGFVILDIDGDQVKAQKVMNLIKTNKHSGISFIVSNPTFEVWFLLHYIFTTKYYDNGDKVIRDLKKHIPDYDKGQDTYEYVQTLTIDALKNAERLANQYRNVQWPSADCNPRTDVNLLVEMLMQ